MMSGRYVQHVVVRLPTWAMSTRGLAAHATSYSSSVGILECQHHTIPRNQPMAALRMESSVKGVSRCRVRDVAAMHVVWWRDRLLPRPSRHLSLHHQVSASLSERFARADAGAVSCFWGECLAITGALALVLVVGLPVYHTMLLCRIRLWRSVSGCWRMLNDRDGSRGV
jgi:hypothetical protein